MVRCDVWQGFNSLAKVFGIVKIICQQYCDVLQCIGGVGSSVGTVQCRAVRVE